MTRRRRGVALALALTGVVLCLVELRTGSARTAAGLTEGEGTLVLRVLTVGFGLAGWFLSQALLGSRELTGELIVDAVHEWTGGWNRRLAGNRQAANALLVVSSALIDVLGLFLLGAALFGPSLRPGVALLLLFALRQIAQATTALPTPPGMVWRRPGVPSLFVTYDVANDFFFSGHTAIAVLGAIEVFLIGPPWAAGAAVLVAAFEAVTVLVLRAHYTMDVLMAVVAAFAVSGLASLIV
jgi:hypothetical protein